jgi:hypothetical protein
MRLNLRNALVFSVLLATFFAGSLLGAQKTQPPKTPASAIQVMIIRADRTRVPAEFKVSLYENLIDQLEKKGTFRNVYRDGDRNAAAEPDLIAVECNVEKFEKGSEKMRQVTTVAGATSMTLRCEFKAKDGKSLLTQDITGKVRFLGGNLKATYDFAKKAANVAAENFSGGVGRNSQPTTP